MNQQIEGVPVGTRIKQVALDYPCNFQSTNNCGLISLEPDNVYNAIDLTGVAIPEGYKRVEKDWFRAPNVGEWYLYRSANGSHAIKWQGYSADEDRRRIILEPIKQTERVLVVEVNESDCNDSFEDIHGSPASFLYCQARAKSIRYRIEEREI